MKQKSKTGKVLSVIGNVILWVFVAFAVLMTVFVFTAQSNKDGLPSIGGKCIVAVKSDSMSPTFKAGDLIIVNRLVNDEKAGLSAGDIITYYTDLNGDGEEEINTHRIMSTREENGYVYYTTKGDNEVTNPVNDSGEVVYTEVLAQYNGTKLTGVGTVISFLQTSVGFLCVIVIPLVVFFLFELYRFIYVIVSNKKSKISDEDAEEIKRRAIEEYLSQQKAAEKSGSVYETKTEAPENTGESDKQ